MSEFPKYWTIGVVGHGVSDPGPPATMTLAERDVKCVELGHPGVTYNNFPGVDKTWCACGAQTYPGDVAQWEVAHDGGPLDRWRKL